MSFVPSVVVNKPGLPSYQYQQQHTPYTHSQYQTITVVSSGGNSSGTTSTTTATSTTSAVDQNHSHSHNSSSHYSFTSTPTSQPQFGAFNARATTWARSPSPPLPGGGSKTATPKDSLYKVHNPVPPPAQHRPPPPSEPFRPARTPHSGGGKSGGGGSSDGVQYVVRSPAVTNQLLNQFVRTPIQLPASTSPPPPRSSHISDITNLIPITGANHFSSSLRMESLSEASPTVTAASTANSRALNPAVPVSSSRSVFFPTYVNTMVALSPLGAVIGTTPTLTSTSAANSISQQQRQSTLAFKDMTGGYSQPYSSHMTQGSAPAHLPNAIASPTMATTSDPYTAALFSSHYQPILNAAAAAAAGPSYPVPPPSGAEAEEEDVEMTLPPNFLQQQQQQAVVVQHPCPPPPPPAHSEGSPPMPPPQDSITLTLPEAGATVTFTASVPATAAQPDQQGGGGGSELARELCPCGCGSYMYN